MLHGKREAAWLPFFRGASPITALRAAQPPAAGPLLRLLRNLADAHPGRWCGIWKSHGFPFSVEHLLLQRCALLSLRLPARCVDCSAISLTLPGPLMRRLEAAWLPFSVELLTSQRCALLSLRLPARCVDCSAISLTLPGPLMRRLEAAWLPFSVELLPLQRCALLSLRLPAPQLRWLCNPPLISEIHLLPGTALQAVPRHALRAGVTNFLTPRRPTVAPDTCRAHQARR